MKLPSPTSIERKAHVAIDLLEELAPRVRRWIFRHLGPSDDLDDVSQEALVQIALALDRFRGDASLTTYAHRIAIRVALAHRRKARREPAGLYLVHEPEDARDPESVAAQRQSIRALYRALDALHASRRTAFVLCAIEGLSHEDAAALENVSVNTLRQRLKRARGDLAVILRRDPILGPLFDREERS
jgi:RNA polymerase sigma-70 factor (ECF subfamily)